MRADREEVRRKFKAAHPKLWKLICSDNDRWASFLEAPVEPSAPKGEGEVIYQTFFQGECDTTYVDDWDAFEDEVMQHPVPAQYRFKPRKELYGLGLFDFDGDWNKQISALSGALEGGAFMSRVFRSNVRWRKDGFGRGLYEFYDCEFGRLYRDVDYCCLGILDKVSFQYWAPLYTGLKACYPSVIERDKHGLLPLIDAVFSLNFLAAHWYPGGIVFLLDSQGARDSVVK